MLVQAADELLALGDLCPAALLICRVGPARRALQLKDKRKSARVDTSVPILFTQTVASH